MRYFTKRQGQKDAVPVDIEPAGDNRYTLTYAGRTVVVDALAIDASSLSLLVDGVSHHVEFDEVGDEVLVQVGGQAARIDVADERRLRLRAGKAGFSVEGKQLIAAPMPGKVLKVLVKLGDEVKEGQGLVVVEAMKMENELKSPKAGKVVELPAREGTAVEINAKLVVVE